MKRAAGALIAFVAGDDATVALGVLAALGTAAGAAHLGLDAWWLVPVAVPLVLGRSLWRAARRDRA